MSLRTLVLIALCGQAAALHLVGSRDTADGNGGPTDAELQGLKKDIQKEMQGDPGDDDDDDGPKVTSSSWDYEPKGDGKEAQIQKEWYARSTEQHQRDVAEGDTQDDTLYGHGGNKEGWITAKANLKNAEQNLKTYISEHGSVPADKAEAKKTENDKVVEKGILKRTRNVNEKEELLAAEIKEWTDVDELQQMACEERAGEKKVPFTFFSGNKYSFGAPAGCILYSDKEVQTVVYVSECVKWVKDAYYPTACLDDEQCNGCEVIIPSFNCHNYQRLMKVNGLNGGDRRLMASEEEAEEKAISPMNCLELYVESTHIPR